MTGAEALRRGTSALRTAGIPDPARDARRLLAHALDIAAGRLTLVLPDGLDARQLERFEAAIAARQRRQPVAQIVGRRAFHGRDFIVTPDVLDPRPETETLVERALAAPARHILDLGTGSGCILLTLLAEWPGATGIGTDISAAALAVARRNAGALGLADRATFRQGDWAAGLTGAFDLIVSNPPYISADALGGLDPDVRDFEPVTALSPGGDGLGAYRRLLPQASRLLAPRGRLLVEIGPDQGEAVRAIGHAAGLPAPRVLRDLDGRDRVVAFGAS